jgi:putative DNA primase/helicase
MTAAEFRGRLKGVTRDGRSAYCPVHEADGKAHRPSLSINEGQDGKVLVTCQGGCSTEAVVGALGLTMADLFATPLNGNGHSLADRIACTYDYQDAGGRLLYQAVRLTAPKDFRLRRPDPAQPDQWVWKVVGAVPLVPYRLPELRQGIALREKIFVVEGEKDADRLTETGLYATTNPMGAEKWRDDYNVHFTGADVIIVPDNDEAGRKHAEQVARALSGVAASVRMLELPGLPEKGDVSTWLDQGHTVGDLATLAGRCPTWIADATPPAGRPAQQSASRVIVRSLRQLRQNPELLLPPTPVLPRFAWSGRVTLLASREKSGKSTTASGGAAAKSSGGRFAGVQLESGEVLWVSLEEHPGEVVRRFDTFHANEDRVHVVDTLPDALDSLADAIRQVQPDLVVVDTLPALVQGLVRDPGSAAEWTPILLRLTALARETNAAILLLHHARKSDNTYRDSTAVGANVDVILEMAKVEGDPTARAFRPQGRWAMEPFTLRLVGGHYEIGAGSVSTETLVLFFIQGHPGCSMKAVRDGVQGKAAEVDAALAGLLRQGLVEDRGDAGRHEYHPSTEEPAQ